MNVLLVEDDDIFKRCLRTNFQKNPGTAEFTISEASNGDEAVQILEKQPIDVMITDLEMPKMDGFELLAYTIANHPGIPVIVMTGFSSPTVEEMVRGRGAVQYLEKPFSFDVLVEKIHTLKKNTAEGSIQGIPLADFLQVIECSRKTCTLSVKSGDKKGTLYFKNGQLLDAETGNLSAREAAYSIVCWDDVHIEILSKCRKQKNSINSRMQHILMEGFRLKDEQSRNRKLPAHEPKPSDQKSAQSKANKNSKPRSLKTLKNTQKDQICELMLQLKRLDGFLGVGAFSSAGELLAEVGYDSNRLTELSALANETLLKSQQASELIGVGRSNMIHIIAPTAHVLMRCINNQPDTQATTLHEYGLHLLLTFQGEGNIAIAKMQFEKISHEINDLLSTS